MKFEIFNYNSNRNIPFFKIYTSMTETNAWNLRRHFWRKSCEIPTKNPISDGKYDGPPPVRK